MRWRRPAVLILALVVSSSVVFGLWQIQKDHSGGPAAPSSATSPATTARSDAVIPKTIEPMRIAIPSIGAQGKIEQVGINVKKEIAAPKNPNNAGWYNRSSIPGQAGLAIIDGHVDSQKGPAIFANLKQLKAGDTFRLERTGKPPLTYRVLESHQAGDTEALSLLFSQSPQIKSQLNLITCTGDFDHQTRQYDQRLIVWSKLID